MSQAYSTTQQYMQDERLLPISGKVLKGAVMYRNEPTPIFDFAESVGTESPFDENHKLIEILVEREKDHVGWINSLGDSIVNIHADRVSSIVKDFVKKDEMECLLLESIKLLEVA